MAAPSVCTTPVCLEAASTLLAQMALNWEKMDPCTNFDQIMCQRFPVLNEPNTSQLRKLGPRHSRVLQSILKGTYEEAVSGQLISWDSTFPTNAVDEANFNMVKRAYTACMDTDTIEKTGTKPLVDLLASLHSLWPINTGDLQSKMTKADYDGLADVMYFLEELGIATFQTLQVGNNPWDPVSRCPFTPSLSEI
jgi:endothelin-converting enzyme